MRKIADVIFADISNIGGVETGTRRRLKFFSGRNWNVYSIIKKPKNPQVLRECYLLNGKIKYFYLTNIGRILPLETGLNILLCLIYIVLLRVKYKVRIYHCHEHYSGFACALAKFLIPDIKYIVTSHGPASYEHIHFNPREYILNKKGKIKLKHRIYRRILLFMEKVTFSNADMLVSVSEFEKKYFENVFNLPKKFVVIRNSIDTNKFKPRRLSIPEIPNDKIVITFVGRLVKKNGPDLVVYAISEVIKRAKNVHFVIVGEGPLRQELEKFVEERNIRQYISFLGKRYDIDRILNASDIFVSHCSTLVDGIGNNVIEALSSGLPCIVGRDYITENIFTNYKNGILVEKDSPESIAKAVLDLVNNRKLHKKISKNARQLACKEFSIENNMEKIEKLAKMLLSGNTG